MFITLIKATGIWLIIVAAAILNGLLREKLLTPAFGAHASLPLSGVTLSFFIFTITCFLVPFIGRQRSVTFILIGLLWLALTLCFEYLFGYFVLGKSLAEINGVFNLKQGNLFVVALIVSAAAPWICARFRGFIIGNNAW